MSEVLNPANTTGSTAPLPQEMLEVTREEIDQTGWEDISVAADNYLNHSYDRMVGTTSPTIKKAAEKQIEQAQLTANVLDNWLKSNIRRTEAAQGHETFKDFLDRSLNDRVVPEGVYEANEWAYTGSYDKFVGDAIRARWQREALEATPASASQTEPRPDSVTEARQEAEQQRAMEAEARASAEQARGVEVFDDVVKFAKDKTYLHTDVFGFTDLGDVKRKGSGRPNIPKPIKQEAERNPDILQHLNEAVMFSDLTELETYTVTKERQVKGRFGRSQTEPYTASETVPGSDHPVMIHNEQTGQDEPAVRFRYNFGYSIQAVNSHELPRYQEFTGGRSGQTVMVGIDLPKSIANKLQTQIESDPASARDLAEKLFLQNNDGQMTEEYWRKGGKAGQPIRPPYEGLPKDWNIAVITGIERTMGAKKDYDRVLSHQVKRVPANR